MQAWPLEKKVQVSTCRIEEWHDLHAGQVYVAFSGGKDSTVLLHLVRTVLPEVPAVFVDTGLEYPEIKSFVRGFENVEVVRPEMSFRQVIKDYGYPVVSKEQARYIHDLRHSKSEKLRNIRTEGNRYGLGRVRDKWMYLINAPFEISDRCCYWLKKRPSHVYEKTTGRAPYLGVLAAESSKRVQDYLRFGCNAWEANRPVSRPIAFWTEQDVFAYAAIHNLPFASVYGEVAQDTLTGQWTCSGVQSTGCIFCAFGVHLEDEPNRFQRLQQTHPQLWRYCMEDLGMREVLEYIGVPYAWRDVPVQMTLGDMLEQKEKEEEMSTTPR